MPMFSSFEADVLVGLRKVGAFYAAEKNFRFPRRGGREVSGRAEEIRVEMRKASFGGDRSEAGRYAANVRWQGRDEQKPSNNEKFAPKQSNEAKNDLTR